MFDPATNGVYQSQFKQKYASERFDADFAQASLLLAYGQKISNFIFAYIFNLFSDVY